MMLSDLPPMAAVPAKQVEPPAPPILDHPAPAVTPEQARAADAVFAEQKESSVLAGLLGLWSGGMLLKDLATEHFAQAEDEDEEEEDKENKQPKADE
jgi:hypothetical protein